MADNVRTYERYYSASDVQIIISNTTSDTLLTLDLATGIGFNESAPMQPIYGLNNILPSFFVRGNSLVTGFLGLAYKYEAYLRKAILYVNGIQEGLATTIPEQNIKDFDTLKAAIAARDTESKVGSSTLLGANYAFNLSIIFSTDSIDGAFESVTLQECYLTGRSFALNSDGENPVSEGYSIICPTLQ